MTRSTSIETYRQIESEGLLSRLRFDVYKVLFNGGPMTQGEVVDRFGGVPRPSITPRFAELERFGVIESIGERPCRVTGRKSMVWQTNDRLPVKPQEQLKLKCPHCNGKGTL